MMLETHTRLCVTEPDFFGEKKLPPKWTKNGVFHVIEKSDD